MTDQISRQLIEIINWTTIGLMAVTVIVALIVFTLAPDLVRTITDDERKDAEEKQNPSSRQTTTIE